MQDTDDDRPSQLPAPEIENGRLLRPVQLRAMMRRWCNLSWKREQQKRSRASREQIGLVWTSEDEWQEALLREEIRALEKEIVAELGRRQQARVARGSDSDDF